MESTSTPLVLSNTSEAVRKRKNRLSLKERRREDKFVNKFIEIKYPDIHARAIDAYKVLVDRYPGRADITKTYMFKKWETETRRKEQRQLYVPFLPILTELPRNTNPENMEEGQQQHQEEGQQHQEEGQQQQQEEPQKEIDEQGEAILEDPQIQFQEEIVGEGNNDICSDMTLDQMAITVEEIVRALQSDREVMDIVENFDLPDGVWDAELAIPDYVLEGDLDW